MPFVRLPLLSFHIPLTSLPSPTAGPHTHTHHLALYLFILLVTFIKYVSSAYYVPTPVLGTGNTARNQTHDLPSECLHSLAGVGGAGQKSVNGQIHTMSDDDKG